MNKSLCVIRKNTLVGRYVVYIVLIFWVSLFLSCGSNDIVVNEETKTFSKFPKEDTITFSNLYDLKKVQPGMIILFDSNLVILNISIGAKYFLYNYSLRDNKLSDGYLPIGRGPGEAISTRGIGLQGNCLWFHDLSLNKILTIDIVNALKCDDTIRLFNEHQLKGAPNGIGFRDSIHFFSKGSLDSDSKFQEIDFLSGDIIENYGKYLGPKNTSLLTLKAIYESFIYVKPTGDKVALPYRYMDIVEFIDLNTNKSFAVHGPEGYVINYEPIANGIEKTKDTRMAFDMGAVTNKYLYLSYSGKFLEDDYSYNGNSIYVYDWEGNPVRKLVLNCYIEGFAVSNDDKVLYAYDLDTGYLMKSMINL